MIGRKRKKNRKIAIISEHASPLADPGSVDSGGQNVYVAQIARHLARQGHQVDVFTRRDDDTLPDIQVWEDQVRVIHVPAGPPEFVRKEELFPYMQEFTDFMVKFIQSQGKPYDVLHANFWMSAYVAANLKQILGIPFIVTFHALGRVRRIHQGDQDGFPDIRFNIEDRVMLEADRIIAECPQDQHDLLSLYPADPGYIDIIPCGFDPQELWPIDRDHARRALGIREDERVILQLGRMVPRKGVDNVVQALAHLLKDHDLPARLVIVGGGSETPDPKITPEIGRLQKIAAEEGISEQICFTGRRGRKALKYFYSAADIFVSTPWYEPFGITPVEAMACGTPVVGAKVGGIQYTVSDGETGFLVPPNDPQKLAEKLAYLFKHPKKLEKFRQQALKRANELFTWQKVADAVAALIEDVLAAPRPVQPALLASAYEAYPASLPGASSLQDQREIVAHSFETALESLKKSEAALEDQIVAAGNAIIQTLAGGGRVMVCGNGGSAADAQHFAAEFVGRFMYPDRKGLPVHALTAETAFLTAWSNDVGYEQVFSRQVETFGSPGDLLIAISTSGRSKNLVEAFQTARTVGIQCLALLGGDGGDLAPLADLSVIVPSANTQRIQEIQILVLHMLAEMVEVHFISEQTVTAGALLDAVASDTQSAWELQPAIPVQLGGTEERIE